MSDFPLLDFLKGLATLATKSDFLWTSATDMDTMLVTAMLVQQEEGLLALSGLFFGNRPTRQKGEMHMPLDLSNFVEMHLFPDSSGLFSKKSTLGAELSLWWQTDPWTIPYVTKILKYSDI